MRIWALISVAAALVAAAPAAAQGRFGDAERTAAVTGAGSTFAFPVVSAWARAYRRAQSDVEFQPVGGLVDYEPIGSEAGLARVRQNGVDFGATDLPLSPEELQRDGLRQFPFVIGGVALAVHLDGVAPGALKLTGPVLAEIYLGRITSWSDPVIKALNPGLALPDAPIVPVRRSDGSGTTFNLTHYLSKVSPDFKARVGEGLNVIWPTGVGAKGNDGVAEAVRTTKNAIGYVELAQARRAGLNLAQLQNRAGAFVAPSPASFQTAAANADWAGARDFNLLLVDAPGEGAYPITATVFAVMPRQTRLSAGARATLAFFGWALENGGGPASELGYVPLPPSLVAKVRAYWQSALGFGT
jgi:phosphate transport system substrate-binding protein